MKTDLQVNGRAQLSHQDVSQAIIEWLANHHNYKVEKVIYPNQQTVSAIAEIVGTITPQEHVQSFEVEEKQKRTSHFGRKMVNVGVFDTMRDLLNDAFVKNQRKETVVLYWEFRNDIIDLHPNMTDKLLRSYLNDTRQLSSNVEFDPKKNQIIVRSIINH